MNDEKIMPNPQFPYEETLKYIKLAQSGDREAMNELVERNTLTNFRETAKELGVPPRKFVRFLLDKKYIFRDKKGKLICPMMLPGRCE